LVAKLRLGLGERTLAVKPRPHAVGAGKLAIDEHRHPACASRWRQFVGRDEGVDGRYHEGVFGRRQGERRFRFGRRGLVGGLPDSRRDLTGRQGRGAHHGAFQKVAARNGFIGHRHPPSTVAARAARRPRFSLIPDYRVRKPRSRW
jgi:hypothetical protein